LYRITGKNQAVALAATGRQEINRIAVLKDGTIFFSATGRSKNNPLKPNFPPSGGGASTGLRSLALAAEGEDSPKMPPPSNAPNLQPRQGKASMSSLLYRMDQTGFAQALWGTSETILSLLPQGKEVWIGTGNEGRIYSMNVEGQVTQLTKLQAESVTGMLPGAETGVLAFSSHAGALWKLGGTNPEPGVYESDVIDSGSFARWGGLRMEGRGNSNWRTRSGNTPKPDKSWYPWTEGKDDHVQSPSARYLQFELRIREGDVRQVEVSYLAKNLPPRIIDVQILPPGIGFSAISNPPIPPQPRSPDQILNYRKMADGDAQHQPLHFQPVERHGLRTLAWKAEDLNDDDLRFTLSYRPEGTKPWLTLAKDLSDTVYSWDTTGWPDGKYEIKVTASDSASNPEGDELTNESAHHFLTIDNTPPVVKILKVTENEIEFSVTEEAGLLASVQVSTDGQDFLPVRPVDGILDSKEERFIVPISGKAPLFIRAEDDSGNIGGGSAHLKP
jgi:hypothetical protein